MMIRTGRFLDCSAEISNHGLLDHREKRPFVAVRSGACYNLGFSSVHQHVYHALRLPCLLCPTDFSPNAVVQILYKLV